MLLIGNSLPENCRVSLEKAGYEVFLLPPFPRLPEEVASHCDMLLFGFEDGVILCRDYYLENRRFFDGLGIRLVLTDETLTDKYPGDILFNALDAGDGVLVSNTGGTSKTVLRLYKTTISVRQGYTRCSTAKVGKGFLTADRGIFGALVSLGREVLLIKEGGVVLPGYGHGFIGGASLSLDEKTTAFFGDITSHPSFCEISEFAKMLGVTLVSLSNGPLFDCGGGWRSVTDAPQ